MMAFCGDSKCDDANCIDADCLGPRAPAIGGAYDQAVSELGRVLDAKNNAYGNSWAKAASMLALLFPDGVKPEQYLAASVFTRMFDKMARVAEGNDEFEEDALKDLAGYAVLLWSGNVDGDGK